MTAKLETSITRWNGISSDIKPLTDVHEGSTYKYVDTGEKFIFHNGMWEDNFENTNAPND